MNELVCFACTRQLKCSLSKAFSRRGSQRGLGGTLAKKPPPKSTVRSAGEAWSDTETDAVDTAAAGGVGGGPGGALSMPNSPSLGASRLRTAEAPSSPTSPPSPSCTVIATHSSPRPDKLVAIFARRAVVVRVEKSVPGSVCAGSVCPDDIF